LWLKCKLSLGIKHYVTYYKFHTVVFDGVIVRKLTINTTHWL